MTFKVNTWTPERIAQVRELRAAKLTSVQIAIEMGTTQYAIQWICQRDKIPSPREKTTRSGYHQTRAVEDGDVRKASLLHLADIHREHGFNKVWLTCDIPPETATPMRRYYSSSISICGSPSALCALEGSSK